MISKAFQGMTAGLAFLGWGALLLSDPSYAHGRALGAESFLVITGLLAMSVLVTTFAASWLLGDRARFSLIAAVFFVTPLTYEGLLRFSDRDGDITETLVTAKIDYHCVRTFSLSGCVNAVSECPRCARQLPPARRAIAFKRMKDIDDKITKARIDHEEQMFHRVPAAAGRDHQAVPASAGPGNPVLGR